MKQQLFTTGTAVCRLIGQFVCKTEYSLTDSLPPVNQLAAFAKRHNILPILSTAIMTSGCYGNDDCKKLDEISDRLSFYQIKTDAFAKSFSAELESAKIKHMILKGIEFSKYYPPEFVRTTADIDFYIKKDDAEKAVTTLKNKGFCILEENPDEISLIKKPYYHIEIHSELKFNENEQNESLSKIISSALRKTEYRYALDDTGNLIFALMHLYKHFSSSGAGVRMLLDVWLIERNGKYNRDLLNDIIDKSGLKKFYGSVMNICKFLFEGKELDSELMPALFYIFAGGSFGTTRQYIEIKSAKYDTKASRVKNYLKTDAGFSNENIKNKYPITKKHPLLIPYFHVHRVVSGLINKHTNVHSVIEDAHTAGANQNVEMLRTVMKTMGIKQKD